MQKNPSSHNPYALNLVQHFMSKRYHDIQKFKPINNFIVQDRLFSENFDIFIKVILEDNLMTEKEFKIAKTLYLKLSAELKTADIVIFLKSDYQKNIERIHKRKRDADGNISKDYLLKLHKKYQTYFNDIILKMDTKLIVIDTNDVDENQVAAKSLLEIRKFVNN